MNMCRWKTLVIFIQLCHHLTAQPIEDIDNDRSTRQLDFGECCPCNNNGNTIEGYDGLYDVIGADSESLFPQPREFNNCPCRDSDTKGSSSVFFPSSLRYSGNNLRSNDKKENLKPIFNPEVDLAASVLETLREVTDEEYQDALVRDAVKSAAKHDFTMEDATPEESANTLAVVVQPNFAASDEDVETKVLHSQKSRCIHAIDDLTSIGKIPVLSQPSFTLRKPLKMRHFLSYRNFDHADNGVDASDVHEQIAPITEDGNDLDADPSYLETVTNEPSLSSISSTDEYCNVGKFPNFRSARIRNNLKNFTRPNLLQTIREKSNIIRIPTIKTKNWSSEKSETNKAELDLAVLEHEMVETKMPYFSNKPNRQSDKENNGPLSLKNLRKLKDVELIPLKELIGKRSKGAKNKKPKLQLPSILRRDAIQVNPKYDVAENDSNINYNRDVVVNSNTNCFDEQIFEKENNNDLKEQKSFSNNFATNDLAGTLDKEGNNKPEIITGNNWTGTENYDKEDSLTGASNNLNKIVSIPTYFARNIERHFKNIQSAPTKLFNQNNLSQHSTNDILGGIKNEEECQNKHNEFDSEQQTDEINEVTTTLKAYLPNENLISSEIIQNLQSHILGNNLSDSSEYNSGTRVTVEDLQNLSNFLLKQERKDIESENSDQQRYEEMNDNIDLDMNLDKSKQSQFENVVESTDISDFYEGNTCNSVVVSPRSDLLDGNIEVTTIANEDNNVDLQSSSIDLTYLPTINPLPALDDMKGKLGKLFYEMDSDTNMSSELSDNAKDENFMEVNEFQTNDLIKALETDPKDKVTDVSETINNFLPEDVDSVSTSIIQQPQLGYLKEPLQSINDVFNMVPSKTILEDIKVKLNNLFDNSKINMTKKINSDNGQIDTELKSEKCEDFNGKHVETDSFEGEIITPNTPLLSTYDADFEARDMEKNNQAENQNNDDFYIQTIFQPQASILNESYTDINDLLNTANPKVVPTLDDIKLKASNLLTNNNSEINTYAKVISEEEKIPNYRNYKSSEEDNCKITKSSKNVNSDSDVGASETIIDIVPKNKENLGLKSVNTLHQPPSNLINKLKAFPFEFLRSDMKVQSSNWLDKNDRTKEINPLESPIRKQMSNSPDLSNPVMATDASKYSFQTWTPSSSFLDNSNLNDWEFNPLKNVRNSKWSKDLKLKPLNGGLLGEMPLNPKYQRTLTEKSKFRNNQNSPSMLRFPFDIKDSFSNSGEIFTNPRVKAKEKHAFNSLFRKLYKPFENTLQQIPKYNLKPFQNHLTSSANILDKIAKNHEDFDDKIRNLHTDFNAKIKSVQKGILDRSKSPITAKASMSKELFRSSSNVQNQNKPKQKFDYMKAISSERDLKKFTSSLKSKVPKPIKKISLPKIESKIFRMPTAASILVPKTVQVPELKPTSKQPPSPSLRKESTKSPWIIDLPDIKQRSESPKIQTNNLKDLQKQFNSKKKSTVKVSFSSTPLPSVSIEDNHNKVYNNLFPNILSASNIGDNIRNAAPLGISSGESNSMASWPKNADTSFLSKVKDAVQSKLIVPTNLKKSRIMADGMKTFKNSALSTNMSQAASEHKNINDMVLKENVSYKCKMICTKE